MKTHRGDLARQPANHRQLHWAQVRVYGWLLCQERGLDEVELALVYFDVGSQKETLFTERASAAELQVFFEAQCLAFIAWAEAELAHQGVRNTALQALRFPTPPSAAASVNWPRRCTTASTGCCLLAQAPPVSARPWPPCSPAQGPGRRAPGAHLLPRRQDSGAPTGPAQPGDPARQRRRAAPAGARAHRPRQGLRAPRQRLPWRSLPLGAGFYDRLPAARKAAAERRWLDRAALREVALAHGSAPTTWARRWRAGATWWWATTTTTSTSAPCSSASPRPTSGASAYWWTRPTTWWSGRAPCTPPNCARAR